MSVRGSGYGRFAEARSTGLVLGLDLEGVRHEHTGANVDAEHRLTLGLGWRLESARTAPRRPSITWGCG